MKKKTKMKASECTAGSQVQTKWLISSLCHNSGSYYYLCLFDVLIEVKSIYVLTVIQICIVREQRAPAYCQFS